MRQSDDKAIDDLLADIVHWSERIEAYILHLDDQAFEQSKLVQDAVIRCLEVVGEASKRILKIDPDFQVRYPLLELKQAYRARNRTAHGYGSVSVASIWRSATFASPRLAQEARRVLAARRR